MRKLALLAAIPTLALLAACGPTETKAAGSKPAGGKAADAARGGGTTGKGTKRGSEPGVTEQELTAVQKVAACLRAQGIKVAEPKVGVPFDSSGIDDAFDKNPDLFGKALAACPEYKKVVVGVN